MSHRKVHIGSTGLADAIRLDRTDYALIFATDQYDNWDDLNSSFIYCAMEWIKVFAGEAEARSRILPDHPQLVILHGTRICLTLHNDKFFAVQDACTHNGTSLSKGHLNYLGEIICPLHNYCFNMQTGREISGRSADLQTFPLKIDASGFFVGI